MAVGSGMHGAAVWGESARNAPMAVSPGSPAVWSRVEARCPTFSWGAVSGATEYELSIYRADELEEPSEPLRLRRLPGSVTTWTPGLEECLARGGRYAWTVRAESASGWGVWSPVSLFEVEAGPSIAEIEEALAVLARVMGQQDDEPANVAKAASAVGAEPRLGDGGGRAFSLQPPGVKGVGPEAGVGATPRPGAAAPTLGTASLSLDNQIHLEAASQVFKDGKPFLWSDSTTLALGSEALASNTTGVYNTAVGRQALRLNREGSANTAVGDWALRVNTGSNNTAVGEDALAGNLGGSANTAVGTDALRLNESGHDSVAIGFGALETNLSGFDNVAIGNQALGANKQSVSNVAIGSEAMKAHDPVGSPASGGNVAIGLWALRADTLGVLNTAVGQAALHQFDGGFQCCNTALGAEAGASLTSGQGNIFINSDYAGAQSYTLRIGNKDDDVVPSRLERAFIHGIRDVMTGVDDAVPVIIDSEGQLGTIQSSRRYKEEIRDLGEARKLLSLRPVEFRYRQPFADGSKPLQFGLVAEEVAEVFPELVVYDDQGRPQTVRYHWLSTLLLAELIRQDREIAELRRVVEGSAASHWLSQPR